MPHWLTALLVAATGLLLAAVNVDPPLRMWLGVPGLALGAVAFVALLAPWVGPLLAPLCAAHRPGLHRRSHP